MSRRSKKVQSVLMSELSTLLLLEVSDPVLQNISISEVKVTDFTSASVYFTVRGEGAPTQKELKEIMKGFQRASPFLKRELGRRLALRTVPDLEFFYDEHLNELTRVMSLLDSVKTASPASPPSSELRSV